MYLSKIWRKRKKHYLCRRIPTFPTIKTITTMKENDGKHIFGVVRVSEKGQIVIPKEARKLFDIQAGDALLILGDESKGLALVKTKILDEMVEGVFK